MSTDVGELLRRAASAPLGPVDYDWVDRRARERRRRRNLVRLAAASVATVSVVGVAGAVATSAPDGDAVVTPAPAASAATTTATTTTTTTRTAPSTANRLVPVVRSDGSRATMPLVLPDGSRVELTLPGGGAWDGIWRGMEAHPYVGFNLSGVEESDVIAPAGGVAWFAARGHPEAEILAEPGRTVTLWDVSDVDGRRGYLVFDFGTWVVGVAAGSMSDAQLRTFARNLHGSLADGFLVLRTTTPLRFLKPEEGGPPYIILVDGARRGVEVRRASCTRVLWDTGEWNTDNRASVCRPEWGVTVDVHGPRAFVDDVLAVLDVRSQ
jgi:hypothetical protein